MKDDNNIYKDLITKSLVGEATVAEENQLQEWLATNPEDKKDFEESKRVIELTDQHYATGLENPSLNVDNEWQVFLETVESKKTKVVPLTTAQPNRWLKIAAGLLLIVASGFIINFFLTRNSLVEYQTADVKQEIILPDQSKVTLNRNSSLSYRRDYGKKDRKVKLKGEAFFEVTHNEAQAFIINTTNAQIRVLGTSFNVHTSEKETEVVVATGMVKFTNKATNKGIILKAGNKGQIRAKADELILTENHNMNYDSWKTGKIIFDENNLTDVLNTLKSVYGTSIEIESGVNQDCEVTVTFDQQSLDAVLNVLKSTLNLTYETKGNKIIITDTGC